MKEEKMQNQNKNQTIEDILIKHNAKPYRYEQIYKALYQNPDVKAWEDMFTVPEEIRKDLAKTLGNEILTLNPKTTQKTGETEKVLFETHDGHSIEAVKMHYENGRNSYCVSTQSGCAMGCAFCATGQMGLKRNLTTDEIVDQVLYFAKQGYEVDNVVFMGMGEPFLNPATFEALEIMTHKDMLNLGSRKVSVSTVGIIPGIHRMTKEFPQINLAFSLHTPFQDQREKLMPVSKSYPVVAVMEALAEHIRVTNRKVFIAYILLGGVTDSLEHAQALAGLINSFEEAYLFHVNLINYHEVPGGKFKRCSEASLERFRKALFDAGIRSTVRQDFGEGIDAACGQLGGEAS
ncbi:23S rRNA (adenine(2503)-C(2))-methyltransferase RlmN [candidate division WWE3 bacterium]|nr:23S rRNA (adenine(2503)-C(2))-methyltransferase RlmN [candidate division WWE3 bacterium]